MAEDFVQGDRNEGKTSPEDDQETLHWMQEMLVFCSFDFLLALRHRARRARDRAPRAPRAIGVGGTP